MLQQTLKKIIYISILLYIHILTPSILKNTLIKTPNGPIKVENIAVGDSLIGYNKKQCVESSITTISLRITNNIIIITTTKGDVHATPDQLFYDPVAEQWIAAKKITPGTMLLDSKNNECPCLNVRTITVQPTNVYHISTTEPHTFFVYDQELLTHNFPPIAIGVAWLFGGGIEFLGATVGTAVFGAAFGINIYKKHNSTNAQFAVAPQTGGTCGGGYNPDPNDDEHNERERKFNTISKSEFFKLMKKDYEHCRDNVYRRKRGSKGIEDAEYLEWDYRHNDIEAYSKSKWHLGSIDPKTLKLYKGPVQRKLSL